MAEVPNGTVHPPPAQKAPCQKVPRGRIAAIISDVACIPFSIVASLTGANADTSIDPFLLGQIRDKVQDVLDRDIPPLPEQSPEGSVWTLGSLTAHLSALVNQATESTP
ncbi:MAG: hypothetical protein AAB891_01870 [Patescibacteria group bacterium]